MVPGQHDGGGGVDGGVKVETVDPRTGAGGGALGKGLTRSELQSLGLSRAVSEYEQVRPHWASKTPCDAADRPVPGPCPATAHGDL